MKVTSANKDNCPICDKYDLVMGMRTGNIRIYGCIRCKNAQGQWLKMTDAKRAWKIYKQEFKESK